MAPSYAKYLNVILIFCVASGLVLKSLSIVFLSLALWCLFWLSGFFESHDLLVKKVKFNKDTQTFQVIVENNTPRPLWLKYSIRSVAVAPLKTAENTNEGGMEFMRGSSFSSANSYLLLSENPIENSLEAGKTAILESKKTVEGLWDPSLQSTVCLTASYGGEKIKPKALTVKVPLEVSGTHPYLRKVGVGREFVLTRDNSVVGRARSLIELAAQASENPSSFLYHWERGDLQKWIRDVVGDTALYNRLSLMAKVSDEEIPAKFLDAINKRIGELNSSKFSGLHPLLSDVEPWHAFQFKMDEGNVIGVSRSLLSLLDRLKTSSIESVKFHLARGNDFASWAANVLGDIELSEKLSKVDSSDPEYARLRISQLISQRMQELGA